MGIDNRFSVFILSFVEILYESGEVESMTQDSYHFVREAIAAKIINAIWVTSEENWSDVCTKALGSVKFANIIRDVMFH